jgi:hypothetical protein
MLRVILSGFNKDTVKAYLENTSQTEAGLNETKAIDFGVIQLGRVDKYAHGHDIRPSLIMNYRGPFSVRVEKEAVVRVRALQETKPKKLVKKLTKVKKKLTSKPKKKVVKKKTSRNRH